MKPRPLHIALAFALLTAVVGIPAVASAVLNTDQAEQWLVSDINRARWDPAGYAAAHNFTPASSLVPMPPLAVNVNLMNATAFKAQQTIDYPTFFNSSTHCSTATGQLVCPNKLAKDFGYPIPTWWPLNQNMIESYWSSNGAGNFPPGAYIFMQSPAHRPVIFEWGDRHEIGVGWVDDCPTGSTTTACNYLFIHVAGRSPAVTFITGVVYDDQNGNGRMDSNEPGLSGVTVSRGGGGSTTTNGGGGYSLLVGPGAYTVTASGPGFPTKSVTVRVIDHNVGVDFEKDTAPVAREYPSRLAGADRFATAVEASQFSHPNGADVVYLAVGHNYPDAIASGPAAAAEGAPILLVNSNSVPGSTEAELNRLSPNEIVVLGGSAAISDDVVAYLDARFPTVVRRAGATRYETAAAINQGAFPGTVGTVYIATGENFPDALVAGPAAVKDGGSLLLVRPNEIPPAIAAELSRMNPDRIVVVGSSSAVSDAVFQQLQGYAPTTRIGGADRFALSAEVARVVFPDSKTAYVATGLNYPDALTAGPATAAASGPILLVGSSIPGSVNTELLRTSRQTIVVLGGSAVVSDAILYQLVVDYLPD